MSFTLDKIFTTVTAIPRGKTSIIREVPPCDALKPYIRCFWETNFSSDNKIQRIIPDCCADILVYAENGKIHSNYCAVSNRSFISCGNVKTFGIRFYSWSVSLFSSVNMNGAFNCYLRADEIFDNFDTVAENIILSSSMRERVECVQNYLLNKLNCFKENSDVMNCLYKTISQSGRVNLNSLSEYCAVSKRTLEREFRNHTGVSPKEMIDMIRYQLLWQQCLKPDFSILDSVEKFGYFDAAHLYKDFKKFHGISLSEVFKNI